MRTLSKSLLMLSVCLGLSGAVYAQTAPHTNKDKSAAVSGDETPATKTMKQQHAKETKKAENGTKEAKNKTKHEAAKPAHKAEHKAPSESAVHSVK
jgi:Flp pilus assembly protein TadD